MDYIQKLNELRDDMHKDIVQEATLKSVSKDHGVLRLKKPINNIAAVCCDSGFLVDTHDKIVAYRTVSIEILSQVHYLVVIKKKYQFN